MSLYGDLNDSLANGDLPVPAFPSDEYDQGARAIAAAHQPPVQPVPSLRDLIFSRISQGVPPPDNLHHGAFGAALAHGFTAGLGLSARRRALTAEQKYEQQKKSSEDALQLELSGLKTRLTNRHAEMMKQFEVAGSGARRMQDRTDRAAGEVTITPDMVAKNPALAGMEGKSLSVDKAASLKGADEGWAVPEWMRKRYKSLRDLPTGARMTPLVRETAALEEAGNQHDQGPGGALGGDVYDNVADAIDNGEQPPMLGNRATKDVLEVRSRLHARHYDLAQAELEYLRMQQHVKTMENGKFTTLRTSADAVSNGLDYLEKLNAKLASMVPMGRAADLNKLTVGAADKWAQYGPEAQQTATEIGSLMQDLQPQIAAVLANGNAPQKEQLHNAAVMLNGAWAPNQMKGGLRAAREQLKYKLNAIRLARPAGDSRYYQPPSNPWDWLDQRQAGTGVPR